MCSILETKNNIEYSDSLNHILKSIQNGDSRLKEEFINDYKLFIIKTVSNVLGYYIDDKNNEEYSVGLQAFNEAIDHLTDLLKRVKVHERTIERNRKYVIAVTLLLRSNLEVCKDLLKDVEGKSKKIV